MLQGDAFVTVAGQELVQRMNVEQQERCKWTGYGYNSDQLCKLQSEWEARGIIGVEIVKSIYGYSVRYDSGLQGFGLVMRSQDIGGTLEAAIDWVKAWVAEKPDCRYGWYRK